MIEIRRKTDLDNMREPEPLTGYAFTKEDSAHEFIISCERGGTPLTLSGTVSCRFLRANNTTVYLAPDAGAGHTGYTFIDFDGSAHVILHEDCYNVPGRFRLTVFVTDSGESTVIYAASGSVLPSQAGTLIDSGEAVPSLDDIVDLYGDMQTATGAAEDAAAAVPDMVAEEFDAEADYSAGDYVYYSGTVYRFTADHDAGAWSGTDAVATTVGNEISALSEDFEYNKQFYAAVQNSVGELQVGAFIANGNMSNTLTSWRRTEAIRVIPGSVVRVINYAYRVRIGLWTSVSGTSATKIDYEEISANTDGVYTVESDAYLRIAFETDGETIPTTLPAAITTRLYNASAMTISPKTLFVATNGSDSAAGTAAAPLATINAALLRGANTVVVGAGTYITERVNRALIVHNNLRIINRDNNARAVFIPSGAILAESASAVSGYTKVLSVACSKTFSAGNRWLYQDGVPDASTEITAAERHPAQRGYQYRCGDTRIIKCASSALSDALTEIESDSGYKWFFDSDNGTLYFSCPSAVSSSHPICGSFNTGFFTASSGTDRYQKIDIYGIEIKYMHLNLTNTSGGVLKDVAVKNVFGDGCFRLDHSAGLDLIRCEASRCCADTNGDGFNAHGMTGGETYAPNTALRLIDCWSHDNQDDGFSDHEFCESSVYGGLYEYNVFGGGVTPASGSHCSCHNVYARKNGEAGFLYMNEATDSGAGGQLVCYNCVSENNTNWGGSGSMTSGGFKINSSGNKGIFIGCKAIGETIGFYVTNANASADCIDCSVLDCGSATGGTGTITIRATTPLEVI